jgi:murein L,D-transpeptidase YafK
MNSQEENNSLSKLPKIKLSAYFNKVTLRNVVFMTSGILVFLTGVLAYGVILNSIEKPLEEAMLEKGFQELNDVNLIVDRKSFSLSLYEDTVLIKSYRASFGRNLSVSKSRAGDNATPVGEYKICDIDTNYKYYKFLKLNYPNLDDAGEALRKGLINQKIYDQLRFEFYYEECPRLETSLGNDIGIHGIGRLNYIFKNLPFVYNWTDGSIAVSNENIDEIISVVEKGTKIVIK